MKGFLARMRKDKSLKRVMAFVIAFAMVFSMIPGSNLIARAAGEEDVYGTLEFQGGTKVADSNAVSFTIDEKEYVVTLSAVDGAEWGTHGDNAEWRNIPANTDVTFTLTMPEGETKAPSLMVSGARESFELKDEVYSFTKMFNFSNEVNIYNIQLEGEGQQGPGPGPGPGGEHFEPALGVVNLLCQDLSEAGSVLYRFGFDETVEFEEAGDSIEIPEDETTITIKFVVNEPDIMKLDTGRGVSLNVNGEEKYHLSGDAAEGVMEFTFDLAALTGESPIAESFYELAYGFQYIDESMDKRPRNMLWVYSEEYGQEHNFVDPNGNVDCLVLNGDVDILSIEYDSVTYSKDELIELGNNHNETLGYTVDPGNMGYAQIPSGAVVTVKLLPDYGYQVLRAELNGSEIAPTEDQSVFTFTMPTNHLHLSAVFTACEDEVVTFTDEVEAGTVQLAEGEMDAGSALLIVGEADVDSEVVFGETMKGLEGYELSSCLDIGLQQVFYKGTKEEFWANDKDTLSDDATIALNLSGAIYTDDVKILHEMHNGEVEIIDATVDEETGAVMFKTDSFSTYAIVKASCEHSYSKYVSIGNGKHRVECEKCGEVQPGHESDACSGGTATCTAKAKCSKCKTAYGSLKAHTTKTTITKATLTTNGKIEDKCSVCGKLLKTTVIYAAKTVKLDKVAYTYDGKTKKPAVVIKDSQGKVIPASNYTVTYPTASKKVGEYTVTVTFKGNYKGSKKLTFKINPVKTAISSLTAGSKSFTVKWAKKTVEVTGYEIQYSTSDSFKTDNKTVAITKNGTVKKQIKKLKAAKKYYVRIRTYKTVGNVKFYSEWSAKKSVTTKK